MPEIIRKGDSTSHGGTVLEGSPSDICMGQPIAYIGHKVHCPKCRGDYPIVEGVMSTTLYGKSVAVAGMKTSCGATLIASQFTDTVEWSSATSSASIEQFSGAVGTNAVPLLATALSPNSTKNEESGPGPLKKFDEQSQLEEALVNGLPYFIETKDGRKFSGRAGEDGVLPRIVTANEEEYLVYWGDEALAKMGEGA